MQKPKTLLLLASLAAAPAALAGPKVFAPTGTGGTYNAYELFSGNVTAAPGQFDAARAHAAAQNYLGTGGHLATVTSAAENGIPRNVWGGSTDSTGTSALDGFNYGTLGTFEQGTVGINNDGRVQDGSGFRWVTGETSSYTNWNPGEPNDFDSANGGEDAMEIGGNGKWNDNDLGNTLSSGKNGPHATERFFDHIVEYDLNKTTLQLSSQLERSWMITAYKSGSTQITNLAGADALIGGTDQSASYLSYATVMDFSDSGGDGDFLQGGKFGVYGMLDSDDFAVVGKAKLNISLDETGVPIIFRVNADDGQRLRIDLNRDGDFLDLGELVINDDVLAGDHNVDSSAITFTQDGEYAIEYTFFERGGGAEGEVSANVDGGGFFLVGDAGGIGLIPEPSSAALGLLGLLGLARRRRA